ncbi:SDR family NAD(P)-dependent oxidoreductase [Acidobacteriota bacterium]
MDDFNFNGKGVIVTGGGSGLGFAVARSFMECGADVVIVGRRRDVLGQAVKELKSKIQDSSGTIASVQADMSSAADVERLFKEAAELLPGLDVLVNGAGSWSLHPIPDLRDDEIDRLFQNNYKSVVLGTQAAARHLKTGGAVINFGSFAGQMAMNNSSLYSSLKTAVASFTKSAASELAINNIRVNCVIPGVIRTPMTSEYIDKNLKRIIAPIPMKRVGTEDEVASGVLFLASDLASYITGASLEITGGKYSTQL